MTPPDRARLKARNLELFRRCTVESVYRRLTSLEPKWELVFDEDGTPDLMADGKSVLRPDPAEADYPPNFAPGSIIRFTATAPDRDRIDVHTFRFLDATLNRAAEEGITFYDQPTTFDTFYLFIFGIGLGRQELFNRLEDLRETALDSLGGPAPKEPPPFDGGTAPEGDVLATAKRISRNSPCPCGSGRKYKYCHGAM